MSAAHTPGPWREGPTDGIGQRGKLIVVDGKGLKVADCESDLLGDDGGRDARVRLRFSRPLAEDTANAQLITAAPELLASCMELRDALAGAMRVLVLRDETTDAFICEMAAIGIEEGIGVRAEAAIAKARGAVREDGEPPIVTLRAEESS